MWKVKVNTDNCKSDYSTRLRNIPDPPKLYRRAISWSQDTKYLGVTLDSGLSHGKHVNNINKKESKIVAHRGRALRPPTPALSLKFCHNFQWRSERSRQAPNSEFGAMRGDRDKDSCEEVHSMDTKRRAERGYDIEHARSEAFILLEFCFKLNHVEAKFEMAARDDNIKYCVEPFSGKKFALFKRRVEAVSGAKELAKYLETETDVTKAAEIIDAKRLSLYC
ncbi:hypothetical protein AVEN_159217-1 [Araneus ventricosus]|uniref:Uncharacterized protein n=1 Tax=Araneus ventricosus TaxID=182803 RepID=A0A4Y2A0E2_ARAVE|nr:hypothetical protein AVEN_159217-1 [Araneus ventricosus]